MLPVYHCGDRCLLDQPNNTPISTAMVVDVVVVALDDVHDKRPGMWQFTFVLTRPNLQQ